MDTLELVLPEKMCKRLYSGEMSSCDLLQSCLDFGNPKDGLLSFDNSWHGFLTVFQVLREGGEGGEGGGKAGGGVLT